jgi:gas vesicle protein GvpA/GvpJ/GvpM family
MSMSARPHTAPQSTSIVDILDRVLDKGLVVAGDISISLANVELLTIRIRLLVCSIDKAEQIGLNWWRYDRNLVAPATLQAEGAVAGEAVGVGEIQRLESRIADLERTLRAASQKKTV